MSCAERQERFLEDLESKIGTTPTVVLVMSIWVLVIGCFGYAAGLL